MTYLFHNSHHNHQLKNIINSDTLIKNKDTNLKSFTINSKTIVQDLCILLNIIPGKKSHSICWPKLENDELYWAFLRGYFDGDGYGTDEYIETCYPRPTMFYTATMNGDCDDTNVNCSA
mgnify:CR=1 FL=1